MDDTAIIDIVTQTMWLVGKTVGPILAMSLVVGFAVSLMQSVTQIQEFTLTFVPKLIGLGLVILLGGPWMLAEITGFTNQLFALIPDLLA